jgi:hypothetical protein
LDLRLPRGVLDDGLALGQHGGHQEILRRSDRWELQEDVSAAQPITDALYIAVLGGEPCTHPFETADVKIYGA